MSEGRADEVRAMVDRYSNELRSARACPGARRSAPTACG